MPSDVTEDMNMTNGMDPGKMTGQERMDEVAMLLSLAMMRLWLKRRGSMCRVASQQRAFSGKISQASGNHLGCSVETLPTVTAGKPQENSEWN
jgi:hypothetical protein